MSDEDPDPLREVRHELRNRLACAKMALEYIEVALGDHPDPEVGEAMKDMREALAEALERLCALKPELIAARSPKVRGRPRKSGASTRARILVVDDEPRIGRALQRGLPECDVIVATSASRAAKNLEKSSYDLILCDVVMPRQNGIDLYERLRKRAPAKARALVFMTGGTTSLEMDRRLFQTKRPVLMKPVPLELVRAFLPG